MYNAFKNIVFFTLAIALSGYLNSESDNEIDAVDETIRLIGIENVTRNITTHEANDVAKKLMLEGLFYDAISVIENIKEKDIISYLILGVIEYIENGNNDKAMSVFNKISGNPISMYFIGNIYKDNDDPNKAIYWIEQSAKYGFLNAQYQLSLLYMEFGFYNKAYIWARCATLNGYHDTHSLVNTFENNIFLIDKKQTIDSIYNTRTCPFNIKYSKEFEKLGYKSIH
ncbi:hypothetical protein GNP80_19640 [Aliivibrio fischeri]|uniref:SEL1-like repeat protein n=1 Tax=Aliivibrio fischeri TaxID=668 RepID=UPI0012DA6C92|nr:sel1 repeat family protein [Aliivibrio fischeri]MUK94632.1 hypothetical protein [Aliivibrio fischeri]